MVRLAIYTVALAVSITTFSLSIASLLQPNWISFKTPRSSPIDIRTTYGLFQLCTSSRIPWLPGGDGKSSDDASVTCRRFPSRSQDCNGSSGRQMVGKGVSNVRVGLAGVGAKSGEVETAEKRDRLGKKKPQEDEEDSWSTCDSWVTAGYAAQLSTIFGATAIIASFVVALGGRAKRENGWRVVAGLMSLHAACLIVTMSLIAHEFNTDERFYNGSRLDKSFIMATTAWALDVVVVIGLVLVGAVGLIREDNYEPIPDQ